MQRKFLTNLGLLLTLNILIKPFWILGIDLTVQNVTGAVDYGTYFVIFNFSFLFNIILDFGITNFNNRNIAQSSHLLKKHFSSIILLKLMLAVLYFIVIFLMALILGYNVLQIRYLAFFGLNQFLISLILYLRSNISGLLMFKTDSLISVLDRVLMIAICSVLLWGRVTSQAFRIEWFIYSQTFAYVITALTALVIVIRKSAFTRMHWNWPFSVMIIRRSFPFAILVLLMTFYNRLDAVMLERMLSGITGKAQAGIYASAYRLLDATNMIAYLFAVLLLPLFSRMLKEKQGVKELVRLSTSLLLTVSVIVAVLSHFYGFDLMGLLYVAHVSESAAVFRWLMTGFIPISLTYVFGTLLTANGNLREMNLLASMGVLINFFLNLVLIPEYQALGSSWSSLITQCFIALVQIVIASRVFRWGIDRSYALKVILFAAGVLLFSWVSRLPAFRWEIGIVSAFLLSAGWAFMLRLVHISAIIKILRKE
ncbi:MAG TPA: oligosaccharide flippase family protein [Bacteroidales bacterium]|nr:oligosaccharide flippase family protein [Bacteroidales bacterium]HSA43517.1 oligosaccharide flippase family protein [Bacteroidales bacterium]